MICDWCGASMRLLGPVETGMLVGHASVWLCTRDGCGHEREVFDDYRDRLDVARLDVWRNELLAVLVVRAFQLGACPGCRVVVKPDYDPRHRRH